LTEEDPKLETAFKVVSIMQTVTEELDEKGKRAWRKMLGLDEKTDEKASNVTKQIHITE
jgi:hypothetical protein